MSRKIITRASSAAAVAGLAAIGVLASSSPALANQFYGGTLVPGQQRCVQQYAGYKVRADGSASGQGAKFKLVYNGAVVPGTGSPALVNYWAAEVRSQYGNFPGPGYYTACATNNGTANTNVQLQLRTDGEF